MSTVKSLERLLLHKLVHSQINAAFDVCPESGLWVADILNESGGVRLKSIAKEV